MGWSVNTDRRQNVSTSTKAAEVEWKHRESSAQGLILAADDQEHILEALDLLLRPQGYRIDKVRSPASVRESIASNSYDAILIDLNYTRDTTSGQEGLDLLSQIVAVDATLPVIVMTAWANVELAVEAMRRGARDFVQKPWENERLVSILRTQVELHRALQHAARLEAENRLLRAEGRPTFPGHRACDATGTRDHRACRPIGRECAHHR